MTDEQFERRIKFLQAPPSESDVQLLIARLLHDLTKEIKHLREAPKTVAELEHDVYEDLTLRHRPTALRNEND